LFQYDDGVTVRPGSGNGLVGVGQVLDGYKLLGSERGAGNGFGICVRNVGWPVIGRQPWIGSVSGCVDELNTKGVCRA
jgi:hypothetical protein